MQCRPFLMLPGSKPKPDSDHRVSHLRRPRLGAVAWMVILVLLSLLVATDFVAYLGWTLADGVEVSAAGYVAMAVGVLFSLIIGCGLMALVFYSSRSGYDEPAVFIGPDTNPKRAV